jgi:hypothetical protein
MEEKIKNQSRAALALAQIYVISLHSAQLRYIHSLLS